MTEITYHVGTNFRPGPKNEFALFVFVELLARKFSRRLRSIQKVSPRFVLHATTVIAAEIGKRRSQNQRILNCKPYSFNFLI